MTIRKDLMKENPDRIPLKSVSRRTPMSIRTLKWILWGPIFALLLLTHSFAAEWWEVPPPGQPAQVWSGVTYNPKLTDTFFESDAWGYPVGGRTGPGGTTPDGEDSSRLKDTARCFSTGFGVKHVIELCEAKYSMAQIK
jgi:hypothetical protein